MRMELITGSLIDNAMQSFGLSKLKSLPMPSLNGRVIEEPCELDIQRLIKSVSKGDLSNITPNLEDWFCYRLMPSLLRYGVYPPPYEAQAANDNQAEIILVETT